MIIFVLLVIEILFCYVIKDFITSFSLISTILLGLNTVVYLLWVVTNKRLNKPQKIMFIFGILARVFLLYIDLFVDRLPHSGGDTEGFHNTAFLVSKNISLLKESIYGGMYTKGLGIVYYLMGAQRIFAQSLNIFLTMATIYTVIQLLNKTKINKNINIMISLVLVFFPQGMLFSSILLREAIIVYLTTISFKFCINWIEKRRLTDIIRCILALLIASSFHAGVLLLIIGYIVVFSFYNHTNKKLKISFNKLLLFILFVTLMAVVYFRFGDIFASKLTDISDDRIERAMNTPTGGSAYLKGKTIEGTRDILIYIIPKTIYFMFSPMPWDWRGTMDMISFVLDSPIYIIFILGIFKNLKNVDKKDKKIILLLLLGLIVTIVAFAVGTATSGTAIRHRHKLFYCIVICYIMLRDKKISKEIK